MLSRCLFAVVLFLDSRSMMDRPCTPLLRLTAAAVTIQGLWSTLRARDEWARREGDVAIRLLLLGAEVPSGIGACSMERIRTCTDEVPCSVVAQGCNATGPFRHVHIT